MGDCSVTTTVMETEEDLIAAAQQIMRALESNLNLSDGGRKILSNLGSQLSNIARVSEIRGEEFKDKEEEEEEVEDEEEGLNEIDQQLDKIHDKVMSWENDQSTMIWDCSPEEVDDYIKAVDESRRLVDVLENRSSSSVSEDAVSLRRAHDILQTAMARLEEEFKHLLVQNKQPFEPEHMSFRSTEDDFIEAGSVISSGDDSFDDVVQKDSMGRTSEEYVVELVNQDVVRDLKNIASLMFDSSYGNECSQVFVNVQKDALDDCLFMLEVEKLSIEDVLKMEWNALNSKIRRWIRVMKVFVRVYLASEKLLTDQIFGELGSVSSICFAESSKSAMLQLLNFSEAIAIGPHQPEKLIRILDMYEVLEDLIPDITALYSDNESGSCVRIECHDVLLRLGECAKTTFLEFEHAVATNVSSNAFPGGGVHPLTRYVMNYIKALMDYSRTLDNVLKDRDHDHDDQGSGSVSVSPESSPVREEEDSDAGSSSASAMAMHFRSLISILECNLDGKSKLYKEESLQHLFLMNNIHYMAEKVKGSDLRKVLGDDWIRKHNWQFQQHAMNYERATWSSILALLRDEGFQNPGSNSTSSRALKERLQSFYLSFEEVYKSQTGWSIPDPQLRDDLRISTSLKVIQAYRTYVGRHTNHISEKHIKYSADDLEDYLLDFFEGSQKSLHGSHRK